MTVASLPVRTDQASADVGFDTDLGRSLLVDTNGSEVGGFVEDGDDVFLRGLTDGTRIEVDFRQREVRVNGVASTEDFGDAFFVNPDH